MIISIITPVINGIQFIEECILNVISQECPSVDHVIIDGGSIDGTIHIIQSFAIRYPHIRWIAELDRGQSDAMNKGVALANGEILGFLNVDDYYEEGVLNRVIELFKNISEPAFIAGNCNIWGDNNELIGLSKPINLRLKDLLLNTDILHFPVNSSAYFYHKSLHEIIGLYDVDQHHALDWDFIFRAVQVANVSYIDELWGNYRFIKGTKTFKDIQNGSHHLRVHQIIEKYRKQLPYIQSLEVGFLRWILTRSFIQTVIYFSRHLNEFPWRLKTQINQLFKLITG